MAYAIATKHPPYLNLKRPKTSIGYLVFKFINKICFDIQEMKGYFTASSKGSLNFKATQPKFIFLKCINLSHFASVLALQVPSHAVLRYSYEGKIYLLCKRYRHLTKVQPYRARNS